MPLVYDHSPALSEHIQSLGSVLGLLGTITFSGSYATNGDVFTTGKTLEDRLKRIGLGKVLYVCPVRGYGLEWDATAKKLKVYSSAGTELAAGAYPAALTATAPQVLILGR